MWLHIRKVCSNSHYSYFLAYPEKTMFGNREYDQIFPRFSDRRYIVTDLEFNTDSVGAHKSIKLDLHLSLANEIDSKIVWNLKVPTCLDHSLLKDTKINVHKVFNTECQILFGFEGGFYYQNLELESLETIYQDMKDICPDFYDIIMPDELKKEEATEENPISCKLHFDLVDEDERNKYYIMWLDHNIPDEEKYQNDLKCINTLQYLLAKRHFSFHLIPHGIYDYKTIRLLEFYVPDTRDTYWNLFIPNKYQYQIPKYFEYKFNSVNIDTFNVIYSLIDINYNVSGEVVPFSIPDDNVKRKYRTTTLTNIAIKNRDFFLLLSNYYPDKIDKYVQVLSKDLSSNKILLNKADTPKLDWQLFETPKSSKPAGWELKDEIKRDCSSFATISMEGYDDIMENMLKKYSILAPKKPYVNINTEFDDERRYEHMILPNQFTASEIKDHFTIKNVKFSGYKVIVFWTDKTKTIVTMQDDEDEYDVEKAIMAAFTKKILSYRKNAKERSVNNLLDKWVAKYEEEREDIEAHRKELDKRKAKKEAN